MVLQPGSRVYRIADDSPTETAALFNALAGGLSWTIEVAGTSPGDDVLILGAGQRSLTSVIAAREAGARRIIVTSRGTSEFRLELARELGAPDIVVGSVEDIPEKVREITDDEGANKVLDYLPVAESVVAAVDSASFGGTVLLVAGKGHGVVTPIVTDAIMHRCLTMKGSDGPGVWGYEQAGLLLDDDEYPFEHFSTHRFSIDHLDPAIRTLAGETQVDVLQVTVSP
jgi:threonine dehydrogenase-like Zn-dependent dehydrogenase